MNPQTRRYDAFISYSQAADHQLAPKLKELLERKIARPWYKAKALHVYRDSTDLSATPDAMGKIEQTLLQSDWLILLASERSAQSKWVQREVAFWLKHKSAETIIIAVTDGTIYWDDARGDFDWQLTNALPACLAGVFKAEPLFISLQNFREKSDVLIHGGTLKDVALGIAAPIHKKSKAELLGAERRFVRTFRAITSSVIAVLLVLSVVLFYYFNEEAKARKEAQENQKLAEDNAKLARDNETLAKNKAEELRLKSIESDTNAAIAGREKLNAEWQKDVALRQTGIAQAQRNIAISNLLLAEAFSYKNDSNNIHLDSYQPLSSNHLLRLGIEALRHYPAPDARQLVIEQAAKILLPEKEIPMPGDIRSCAITDDGNTAAVTNIGGKLYLYDMRSGKGTDTLSALSTWINKCKFIHGLPDTKMALALYSSWEDQRLCIVDRSKPFLTDTISLSLGNLHPLNIFPVEKGARIFFSAIPKVGGPMNLYVADMKKRSCTIFKSGIWDFNVHEEDTYMSVLEKDTSCNYQGRLRVYRYGIRDTLIYSSACTSAGSVTGNDRLAAATYSLSTVNVHFFAWSSPPIGIKFGAPVISATILVSNLLAVQPTAAGSWFPVHLLDLSNQQEETFQAWCKEPVTFFMINRSATSATGELLVAVSDHYMTSWRYPDILPMTYKADLRKKLEAMTDQQLIAYASARVVQNFTYSEWKKRFGDEPYRKTNPAAR